MPDIERTKLGPDFQVLVSKPELLSTAARMLLRHRDANDDVLVNLLVLPSGETTDHAPIRFAASSMRICDSLDEGDVFVELRGYPYLDKDFSMAIDGLRQDDDVPEAEIIFKNQDETDNLVGTMSVYLKME